MLTNITPDGTLATLYVHKHDKLAQPWTDTGYVVHILIHQIHYHSAGVELSDEFEIGTEQIQNARRRHKRFLFLV